MNLFARVIYIPAGRNLPFYYDKIDFSANKIKQFFLRVLEINYDAYFNQEVTGVF